MTIEAPKVHVHMTVSNLEKSRAFYEKFFGTAPVKVKPGYVKFLPGFGRSISRCPRPRPQRAVATSTTWASRWSRRRS